MKWAQTVRMAYIDKLLIERGRVNRTDLISAFGISKPQATSDLRLYEELNPEVALRYCPRKKAYYPEGTVPIPGRYRAAYLNWHTRHFY